jgi:hypothetical protein
MSAPTLQSDPSVPEDWYRISNDFHFRGTGEIRDRTENVVWHHRQDPSGSGTGRIPLSWATTFFRRPDFVVLDRAEEEVLRIRQSQRFPRRRFVMLASEKLLGEIEERSLVSDFYAARFTDGTNWSIWRRLFSAAVHVLSDSGARIRVQMQLHNNWFLCRKDTKDNLQIIATLAFIQSEHCRW